MPELNAGLQRVIARLLAAKASDGTLVRLSQFMGRFAVCISPEGRYAGLHNRSEGIPDILPEIEAAGGVLLGVSPICRSHCKFPRNLLNFLLSDGPPSPKIRGVGGESLYGRKFMGVQRATFLVDPKGSSPTSAQGAAPGPCGTGLEGPDRRRRRY